MLNVFEWQAQATLGAANALAHWVGTTHADRLDWKPTTESSAGTRSVLTLAGECIRTNYALAGILSGKAPVDGPTAPSTAAEAQAALMASASAVADAIRASDETVFTKMFETPRGAMPGSFLLTLPAMHMSYHGGQVNLIQLLYGDTEFSFPARPAGS